MFNFIKPKGLPDTSTLKTFRYATVNHNLQEACPLTPMRYDLAANIALQTGGNGASSSSQPVHQQKILKTI